jgi:Spy/CpxP family protein refolding chaperone
MRAARVVLILAVALLVASSALAGPKKGEQKQPKNPPKCPAADRIEKMLAGITLTDEQKAKLEEIKKEYGPKFVEAAEKMGSVFTDEQKKARAEAAKTAKAAGKKGKEIQEAIASATKLGDEQKTKLDEVKKQQGSLEKEFRNKVISVLTPEQKDQMKKAHGHKKAAK